MRKRADEIFLWGGKECVKRVYYYMQRFQWRLARPEVWTNDKLERPSRFSNEDDSFGNGAAES